MFLEDKLTTAVNGINELSPDLVVIAGDLTENGFKTEFEEAKRFIDQIECRHKIVTMGDHDSRYTSFMLFEGFFGPSSGIFESQTYRVVYVNTARPDRDEGRVGKDQIQFIKESLVKGQIQRSGYASLPDFGP